MLTSPNISETSRTIWVKALIDRLEKQMKKQELLNYIDNELLDKLFGFCYARTNDSYEAEELCSDIVYALVTAANTDGEIESIYPFIWRIARNVYADFSNKRRKRADTIYEGNSDEVLLGIADDDFEDDTAELLTSVYRRIAFLTKAYREVMIMFYIDGLSTAEIAKKQGASEGAVRQRLFSARQKIKSEVEEMTESYNKPVALDKIKGDLNGTAGIAYVATSDYDVVSVTAPTLGVARKLNRDKSCICVFYSLVHGADLSCRAGTRTYKSERMNVVG